MSLSPNQHKPPKLTKCNSYDSEDGAVLRNIDACRTIAQTVQTSLGPYGRNKIIINHLQKMILTNTTTAIDFLTHTNPPSSQPRLRNTKSSTTVNDSGGSSVDETTSTRLRLKDAMGTTWRKFKLRNGNGRKGETSSTEEVAEGDVVEEKMQAVDGTQPSATAAER